MTDQIGVCVIGAGRAGLVHARNFRWRVPYARLEAVLDVDPERARQAVVELDLGNRNYVSLEAALDSTPIDAVVITTPTFTHADLVVKAAQAGKHILCEKPMALTLEECDRMIAAAQATGVVLQIAFMRRFDPAFVTAKEQIDEGAIGTPLLVRSLTRGPSLPPPWACDIRTSNGLLAEVNSHDFDTIRWLTGANYAAVFAQAAALKAPHLKEQYPEFYDTAVVALRLENGALGMLDGICPVDYGYDARAEVVGTKGVLLIGELRRVATTRVTQEGGILERHFSSWRDRFEQAYVNEAAHFVACIRNHSQPIVGGFDGRCAVEAVLAANQSIRTGKLVELPLSA